MCYKKWEKNIGNFLMKIITDFIGIKKGQNILFLQGPMGNFFKKLEKEYLKNNQTYRIVFNKGDELYSLKNNFSYRGNKENWKKYIIEFIKSNSINLIFLFGDCRFYHKVAIEVASSLKVDVYVFEEGYIRPNFITLEKNGVNGFSSLINKNFNLESYSDSHNIFPNRKKNKNNFFKMALQSAIYYAISNIFSFQYPYYEHHREFSAIKEFRIGILNSYRFIKNQFVEKKYLNEIRGKLSKKYYFVPLQTQNDFQVKIHSDFNNMEEFIEYVLLSFSKNAPKNFYIVIKHHPLDRGRKNYSKYIKRVSKNLNILSRVIVLSDTHLPTLLKNSLGTVVINSTVGFSSLYHGIPVICLGRSIYDINGLTVGNINLDNFWNLKFKVNRKLFNRFKNFLIFNSQIPTNFYE